MPVAPLKSLIKYPRTLCPEDRSKCFIYMCDVPSGAGSFDTDLISMYLITMRYLEKGEKCEYRRNQ